MIFKYSSGESLKSPECRWPLKLCSMGLRDGLATKILAVKARGPEVDLQHPCDKLGVVCTSVTPVLEVWEQSDSWVSLVS